MIGHKLGPTLFSNLLAGVAEARSGESVAACSHLNAQREIADTNRDVERWFVKALEGEIDLGARDDAGIPALITNCLPFRDGRGRAMAARGDLKGAIAFYRHLLVPDISQKWTSMLDPRHVFALARLLERAGDRSAAREQYERFLTMWRQAESRVARSE